MNTVKESKQFAINPFYRGYLLALKDMIELIDSKKLECCIKNGQWWVNRNQLLKEIEG